MATIEIRKDKRGQFRFTIKSRNGEIVATGESYKQKAKAMATARSLKIAGAKLIDLTVDAKADKKPAKSAKAAKKTGGVKAKKAKPSRASKSAKSARPAKAASKPAAKPAAKKSSKTIAPRTGTRSSGAASSSQGPSASGGVRTPAAGRPPRLVSPAADDPRDDTDDLDTVPAPEGADIVTPDQLGDGDRIADGVEPAGVEEESESDE